MYQSLELRYEMETGNDANKNGEYTRGFTEWLKRKVDNLEFNRDHINDTGVLVKHE